MCMKKNMKYRRLWTATLLVVLSLITSTAFAQPAARRAQQAQKAQQKSNANNMTEPIPHYLYRLCPASSTPCPAGTESTAEE